MDCWAPEPPRQANRGLRGLLLGLALVLGFVTGAFASYVALGAALQ